MKDVFLGFDEKLESVISTAERIVSEQTQNFKNSAAVQKENLQKYTETFKESAQKKYNYQKLYAKKDSYYSGGMAMFVIGIIFMILVAIAMLVMVILSNIPFAGGVFTMVNQAILFPIFVIFVGLTAIGKIMINRYQRYKKYLQIIGVKLQQDISTLAYAINKSERYTRNDIKAMISANWFQEAWVTDDGQLLIISIAAFEEYQAQVQQTIVDEQISALRKEQQDSMSADARITIQTGANFIAELQAYQIKITDANMSGKLSQLERILRKIFARVEVEPEAAPQIRKMVDYYLPTTMKLLNAYVQLKKQEIQGPNILATKTDIEESLDTLLLAYERFLDDLFADVALDIETDITVLNTMLAQDGLVDNELDKMRGSE